MSSSNACEVWQRPNSMITSLVGGLPTGALRPAAGVSEEVAGHIAWVREQGYTVIENVIPPEWVAAIREDVVEAVTAIENVVTVAPRDTALD